MIKVQDNDVALPAIHAWMGAKVLANERPVFFPISPDAVDFLPDIGRPISDIMLASIPRVT
jgi:hypothetical protein